jgi:hypothetical protein
MYFDVFSVGLGILAAGAAETGPAAPVIGVAAYRALSATLRVVCGAVFDGRARTFGYDLETHHEVQVAADIAGGGAAGGQAGQPHRARDQSSRRSWRQAE